jgi:hypothetical protein
LDNVQLRYKEGQGRLSMLVGDMHMLGWEGKELEMKEGGGISTICLLDGVSEVDCGRLSSIK